MNAEPTREIRHVALLDLTGAGAADSLAGVTRIVDVATILVPESLLPRLSSIPLEHVAATVPVPDGSRVRVLAGQLVLSGEALANPGGDPDEVLVVAGQLVLTSPVERVGYKQLIVMGQLLAPVGSETGLGAGLTRMSGQVQYFPYAAGAQVRVVTGSVRLTGAELANPTGRPTDLLVAVGQLVITDLPPQIGYQRIVAVGQVLAPHGGEEALAGRLHALAGQTVYYTAPPRLFDGQDTFYGAYFELLDEPITLVLNGRFVFDDDVSPDLVKQKVAALVLDGTVVAPRRLVPLLQVLTLARSGTITASDAADR
jgi:hypothetical protein